MNNEQKQKANDLFKSWAALPVADKSAKVFKALCTQILIAWGYDPANVIPARWVEAAGSALQSAELEFNHHGACNPSASALAPDDCERCGGAGHIKAFSHFAGGECFECGGYGKKENLDLI